MYRIIFFKKQEQAFSQPMCFFAFAFLLAPMFLLSSWIRPHSIAAFHVFLFTMGMMTWTFIEYIVHRFWMHGKGNALYKIASKRHLHHHKHPHDLKITAFHRSLMFVLVVIAVALSIRFNNYFTLFAGFYTGFAWFCFMHLFLHQKWSRRFFKKIVQYHIFHHCKYTEHCHGVSVTWWDDLFQTAPPKGATISPRIIDFYFEEHHEKEKAATSIKGKCNMAKTCRMETCNGSCHKKISMTEALY